MSKVKLANEALNHLNVKPIASFTEDSKGARAVSLNYDSALRAAIRLRKWNFAIKRALLAASGTDPVFGSGKAFDLPTDFIRLIDQGDNTYERKVEGKQIITKEPAPLQIRYLAYVEDTTFYDAIFWDLATFMLAQRMWKSLSGDGPTLNHIKSEIARLLNEGSMANAWEETPENYLEQGGADPLGERY